MSDIIKRTLKCKPRDFYSFVANVEEDETFEHFKKRFGKYCIIMPKSRIEKDDVLVAYEYHPEWHKKCEIIDFELGAFWKTKYTCGYHVLITVKLHDDLKTFKELHLDIENL